MDFFAAQDRARRNTRRLLIVFAVAVLALIVLSNLAIAFGLWSSLYGAMWRLRGVYPLLKPRLIKGCRAAFAADAHCAVQAAGLLALVAAVLDCPVGDEGA